MPEMGEMSGIGETLRNLSIPSGIGIDCTDGSMVVEMCGDGDGGLWIGMVDWDNRLCEMIWEDGLG